MEAEVTRCGILDMQVCVPASWNDEEVVRFAEMNNPSGTENGWIIRKQGDPLLQGCAERVECKERKGFVHIMLDA